MGEQENCIGSSKKRPMAAATPNMEYHSQEGQVSLTKKRFVLGDLTNVPNITNFVRVQESIPKSKLKITTRKAPEETVNSDAEIHDDPQKFPDTSLIYQHLRSLEVEENRRPLHNYMEKVQNDITPAMREILVDWLVEVVDEYKLVSDTLYLTVNYVDRFLSSHTLPRTKLQLLGVSSMLVASKFEEITPPHIEDCCYITDNTYTREEVVSMENDILKFLNFNTPNPTSKSFLRMFTRAAQEKSAFSSLQFELLACYIMELSLIDYVCVRFLPSVIAASAIFLAKFTMLPSTHPWNLELQRYTGYKASDLKECVLAIHDLQLSRRGTSARAVRDKYMEHRHCVHPQRFPNTTLRLRLEIIHQILKEPKFEWLEGIWNTIKKFLAVGFRPSCISRREFLMLGLQFSLLKLAWK